MGAGEKVMYACKAGLGLASLTKTNLDFRTGNRRRICRSSFNEDGQKSVTHTTEISAYPIHGVYLQHYDARRREDWFSEFLSRVVLWVVNVGVEFSLHVDIFANSKQHH